MMKLLVDVFTIKYGSRTYINKSVLDPGLTPLIASQGVDNGIFGYFNIPIRFQHPVITVPRTGTIGYAFVQLFPCEVTDDCIVLTPINPVSVDYLFYAIALIRSTKWRYNYGRKITPKRLAKISIKDPNEFVTKVSYERILEVTYPVQNAVSAIKTQAIGFREFQITDLFNLERGHFHAIDKLEKGRLPTVSRVTENNGVVGFYSKPTKAKIYPPGILTVSTVTADAFIQYTPFIATDNVVVCIPIAPMRPTTLIYIQTLLNKTKWRYSYGRQSYKGNFQKTEVTMPVTASREIDEDYIEALIVNQPFWKEFHQRILK